jgi:hypothetical protein
MTIPSGIGAVLVSPGRGRRGIALRTSQGGVTAEQAIIFVIIPNRKRNGHPVWNILR